MEWRTIMLDYMLPLGGANEVGASAYFLSVDGYKILLDCGARIKGEELFPDYNRLLYEISDFAELNMIIISHGHYDHIGSYAKIAEMAVNAEIYCTADTKSLIQLQLIEFGRVSGRRESDRIKQERYRRIQGLIDRINVKPVQRPFHYKDCKITFYAAGHMTGAVMVYLETMNNRILYSGDFSVSTMFGINGMKLANDVKPNVLLLNSTNAYKTVEEWQKILSKASDDSRENHYEYLYRKAKDTLNAHKNVYFISRSVPKHLDLFRFIIETFPDIPIYVEEKSRMIQKALSDMGYQVYSSNLCDKKPETEHIMIGQLEKVHGYKMIDFDRYSLHATPLELMDLMELLQPEVTYLLHTIPNDKMLSIKKILVTNRKYQKQIIQTCNHQKYYLKRESKMKYYDLYLEALEKDFSKATASAEKHAFKGSRLVEWLAIYGSFVFPEDHPRVAFGKAQKLFCIQSDVTYHDYLGALRDTNLDSEEKRRHALEMTECGIKCFKKALDGDTNAVEQYSDLMGSLEVHDPKSNKYYFLGKFIVVFMLLIDPDLKADKYRIIAFTFGAKYCDKLLRNIRDSLLKSCNMKRKKKSAREVLQKTEAALLETTEVNSVMTEGSEIEQLRFMNNNYKNSLELIQAMFDELKDSIDETAADAKNTEITTFYTRMNSDEYGNLLDSIELVSIRLNELKVNKVRIMPQLLPLTIVFKQLQRFINECGITPIDQTGRVFEAEAEELADYIYNGEAYTKPNEKKFVKVEKPGWKMDTIIISLPTVKEVENDGE